MIKGRFSIGAVNLAMIGFLGLCILLGYGFFTPDILLLDDDIAGRYKAVANKSAFSSQIGYFKQWTMGRPIGHTLNTSFQGIFLEFPEQAIIFFALLAVAGQSYFLHRILINTGFSILNAGLMAIFFFVTPIASSLYLPVHALATETSTWFILGASAAVLMRRPILGGLLASLQFATYETYATIFWMPLVFLVLKEMFNKSLNYVDLAKVSGFYTVSFFVAVLTLIAIRMNMAGVGHEAGIDELGIIGIITRMFEAGWIGAATSLSFQWNSFFWSLENGPKYIILLIVLIPSALYMLLRRMGTRESFTEMAIAHVAVMAGLAILLIYCSYMIYFEQRFPPKIEVSRLANIHSGARFGLTLLFGSLLLLLQSTLFRSRMPFNIAASVIIGLSIVFQHSYGFQESLSSQKKTAIVDALHLACKNSSPEDLIVVIAPIELARYKTDIILAWTTPYIAPTSFLAWRNKVMVVHHIYSTDFLAALEAGNGSLPFEEVKKYTHNSFTKYDWLYPWGNANRWKAPEGELRVVEITHAGDNIFTSTMLNAGTPTSSNICVPR